MLWGMTFEKSLLMFSPRARWEREIHQRTVADLRECLRLARQIESALKVRNDQVVGIIKPGTPIKLYGKCGACHAILQTDSQRARKIAGSVKQSFEVTCPTCGYNVPVFWKLIADGITYGGHPK
jgi:hypothetical protein